MERRLAAILVADVAGSRRLVERDEADTFERSRGIRVRITHEPEETNPGHSAIRNLPDDNDDLLDLLAADAFAELIRNTDIP